MIGTYSIDMIKLKVRVPIEDFQPFMQSLMNNPQIEYWEKKQINSYRHNWTYSVDVHSDIDRTKYSYYLAYRHNTEKPGIKYNLVLQYNPNKCEGDSLLAMIIDRFFLHGKPEIVSADVAIDFPISIKHIVIDKGGKKVYKYFESPNNGVTHYFGVGGVGQVRIYNKTAEAGLNYNLTRYEVQVGIDLLSTKINLLEVKMELPTVHILSTQISLEILKNETLNAILFAVSHGYPLNSLSRAYREKIKSLNVNDQFEVRPLQIAATIKDYVRKTLG